MKRHALERAHLEAREELLDAAGRQGAAARRTDAVVRVIQGVLTQAAHAFRKGLRRRAIPADLRRELRTAIAEGLGALASAARRDAREQILEMMRRAVGKDKEALRRGLAVASERGRFRSRQIEGFRTEELEALLRSAVRPRNATSISAYLAGFPPAMRLERMRPYGEELVAALGSEGIFALFDDARDYVGIEAASFFAPLVSSDVRGRWLEKAVDAQMDHGDQDTLVHLLGCVSLMRRRDGARVFAHMFDGYEVPFPSASLLKLARRQGDLYWMAPLIRRLGGDEALVAASHALVAAGKEALSAQPARRT